MGVWRWCVDVHMCGYTYTVHQHKVRIIYSTHADICEQNSEMYFRHVHKYTLICFAHLEYWPDKNPHTGTQDISKLYKKKRNILGVKCLICKEKGGDWICFQFNF